MELRRVFTLDPERFPLEMVRELVSYLHEHQQHYVVMVDPATWRGDYEAYNEGVNRDIFQKTPNGTIFEGAVSSIKHTDLYFTNTNFRCGRDLQYFLIGSIPLLKGTGTTSF